MASKAATKRLTKEYMLLQKSPPPFIIARPLESNILEWHYVIRGPPQTPYEGGEYHGKLAFPSEYPFKPPSIRMTTPSGRFQTDTKICLSMSDFHPGTWNPSWSVATILTGLLSFMTSDESTTGSISTTDAEKRAYAARSHAFNLKNRKFRDVFPEMCTQEPVPAPGTAGQPAPAQQVTVSTAGVPAKQTAVAWRASGESAAAPANARGGAAGGIPVRRLAATPQVPVATSIAAGAVGAAGHRANKLFTLEPWHKWAVFLVVCFYLLVSRLLDDKRLVLGVH